VILGQGVCNDNQPTPSSSFLPCEKFGQAPLAGTSNLDAALLTAVGAWPLGPSGCRLPPHSSERGGATPSCDGKFTQKKRGGWRRAQRSD